MKLEAVLLWSHQISALVLSDLDLPLPGGGGGAGVDVDVDLIAGTGGRDKHMLPRIVSAYCGWSNSSRVAHSQTVHSAVSHSDTVSSRGGAGCS